jgi:hypothetical protein
MGTGHSIDSPIRVAHFGISSVMSIVDDILIDRICKYYCEKYELPFTEISKNDLLTRSKRITQYLNTVEVIVNKNLAAIKKLPFFEDNDKRKYFELLPESSPLKQKYNRLLSLTDEIEKVKLADELSNSMIAGSIDVNIMSKVDRTTFAKDGSMLSEEFTDAKTALRGFAESNLSSSIVFSAGFNRGLFSYLPQFKDFYRNEEGDLKKKIIIKVSDYRSALIQGKFLASKGLEVSEFRIESGLNCGGHAFASQGFLLPTIMSEFAENKNQLNLQFRPMVKAYYDKAGLKFPDNAMIEPPFITVQGGIGTSGEATRLVEDFGCDSTGWGSPFLLVPEATCVDDDTMNILMNAKKEDLYLSNASPLGVPFNNLRNTGSENWTRERAEKGTPGSACPKGLLISNKEFSDKPICTASRQYQKLKVDEISNSNLSFEEKTDTQNLLFEKVCLCEHLGNGALIKLGITPNLKAPQSICPGPNVVWFNREYSLQEMVDHIYGKGESLVSSERPHMFCQELELYVNYFEKIISTMGNTTAEINYLDGFKDNLENGMDLILKIAKQNPYPNENLESIPTFVEEQRARLRLLGVSRLELSVAVNY